MRTCFLLPLSLVVAGCADAAHAPDTAAPTAWPASVATPPPTASVPPEPARVPEAIEPLADAPALLEGAEPPRGALRSFARANGAFAIDLHARLRHREGNLVYSPASLWLALALVSAGARGETARDMHRALHIEGDPDAHHAAAHHFLARVQRADGGRGPTLRIVSGVFGSDGSAFEPRFVERSRADYGAAVAGVDFAAFAERERGRINDWVARQTHQRIRAALPPGSVGAATRLVVVDAIHFLGRWRDPFSERATSDQTFHREDGGRETVPMMHQTERLRYAEVGDVQVLELGYEGDELAMMFVLPRARAGLPAVEASLDLARLERFARALRTREVIVSLPRFELGDATLRLNEILPTLGIERATDPIRADFSGIVRGAGPGELALSDVIHQANVKVDESGTEAAAATVVSAEVSDPWAAPAPALPRFVADHPFLFVVREPRSGVILFMGRVASPAS